MNLPELPAELYSALGPLPVSLMDAERAKQGEYYGLFLPLERRIEIAPGMNRTIEWATLWHEATHVALTDSGANNVLTEKQVETVCDAMGTYLAGMMRAGMLVVSNP